MSPDSAESQTEGQHTEFELGRTIREAPQGGPAASVVEIEDWGETTTTFETTREELMSVVSERLTDDYPSVYVACDGDHLAVMDHDTPIKEDAVPRLSDLERLERIDVADIPDDAVMVMLSREAIVDALGELSPGRITLGFDAARPLFISGGEVTVGIAPRVPKGEVTA